MDERGCPPDWVLENTGKRCAAMETNGNQVVGNDALHVRIVSMMSYHPCLSTQILKVILGYDICISRLAIMIAAVGMAWQECTPTIHD